MSCLIFFDGCLLENDGCLTDDLSCCCVPGCGCQFLPDTLDIRFLWEENGDCAEFDFLAGLVDQADGDGNFTIPPPDVVCSGANLRYYKGTFDTPCLDPITITAEVGCCEIIIPGTDETSLQMFIRIDVGTEEWFEMVPDGPVVCGCYWRHGHISDVADFTDCLEPGPIIVPVGLTIIVKCETKDWLVEDSC